MLWITFTCQPPTVVFYHRFIIRSLVAAVSWWKRSPCSSEFAPMFVNLRWSSRIWILLYFTVVLYFCLNKLHMIFGLLIPEEAPNRCDEAITLYSLRPSELFWKFLALHDLPVVWQKHRLYFIPYTDWGRSLKGTWRRQSANFSSRYVQWWEHYNTFPGSTSGSHLFFLPTLNSVCCGRSHLG